MGDPGLLQELQTGPQCFFALLELLTGLLLLSQDDSPGTGWPRQLSPQ